MEACTSCLKSPCISSLRNSYGISNISGFHIPREIWHTFLKYRQDFPQEKLEYPELKMQITEKVLNCIENEPHISVLAKGSK